MNTTSLSEYEMDLVNDAEVLFTKSRIIGKVYTMFGDLAEVFRSEVGKLDAGISLVTPKIAKGENYNELPYVILDYPRLFSKNDVFAVRCFFWWGNFFSITLHLTGEHLFNKSERLQLELDKGTFDDWYINASDEEWHHHFEETNYRRIGQGEQICHSRFVKLAKKIPLQEWDEAQIFFESNFRKLMSVLFH